MTKQPEFNKVLRDIVHYGAGVMFVKDKEVKHISHSDFFKTPDEIKQDSQRVGGH